MTQTYNYRGVRFVAKGHKAPDTFKAPCTCGTCGRTWDDGVSTALTPVPAGRCPFEYIHPRPARAGAGRKKRTKEHGI